MEHLPHYVRVVTDGYTESVDPSVDKTEMSRGLARYRLRNTLVIVKLSCTFYMEGKDRVDDFMNWYLHKVKRINFFTMPHPRRGTLIVCRFVDGKIGDLEGLGINFSQSARKCEVEFIEK